MNQKQPKALPLETSNAVLGGKISANLPLFAECEQRLHRQRFRDFAKCKFQTYSPEKSTRADMFAQSMLRKKEAKPPAFGATDGFTSNENSHFSQTFAKRIAQA